MCHHKSIDLIAEMKYKKGEAKLQIYTCNTCRKTLVKNGRKHPFVVDPEYLQLLYTD